MYKQKLNEISNEIYKLHKFKEADRETKQLRRSAALYGIARQYLNFWGELSKVYRYSSMRSILTTSVTDYFFVSWEEDALPKVGIVEFQWLEHLWNYQRTIGQ